MKTCHTLIKPMVLGTLLAGSPAWAVDLTITDASPELDMVDSTANETDWGICVDDSGSCTTGTEPQNQYLHIGNNNDGGFGAAIGLEIEPGAGSTTTPLLHLDNTERVGIKTRTPARDLHVGGGQVRLDPSGTAGDWELNPGGTGLWFINQDGTATTPVKFSNNAPTDSLVIQANGDIEFGGGAPNANAKVYVQSNIAGGTYAPAVWMRNNIGTSAAFTFETTSERIDMANHQGVFRINYTGDGDGDELQLYDSGNLVLLGNLSQGSDKNNKRDIEPVDPQAVLARVLELPISEWSYKSDETASRHIGPMAQDFHAGFGLGADETRISSIDTGGVALAAIQGLNRMLAGKVEELELAVKEKDTRLDRMNAKLNSSLQAQDALIEQMNRKISEIDKQASRLAALEQAVYRLQSPGSGSAVLAAAAGEIQ